MKSMKDYIDEVYEKYEKVEKSNEEYKKVNMKRNNPIPLICGIAACILAVVMFRQVINNKPNPSNIQTPNNENINYAEENNGEKRIFTEYLYIDEPSPNKFNKLVNKSDSILLISNIKPEYSDYNIKNKKVLINTNGILDVFKVLKGDKKLTNMRLEYYMSSGIMSLEELQKDENMDWDKWELEIFKEIIPEEEKSNTYYKQEPIKGCKIEEGKQYLVFLKYDEEKEKYNIWNFTYGIMEYDPITNMVKDIDTGEFVEFDWDLINED